MMKNPIKFFQELDSALFSIKSATFVIEDILLPRIEKHIRTLRVLILLSIGINALAVVLLLILI